MISCGTTINSFAALTASFQSSFTRSGSADEEIISSSRSSASVLAARRARHLASVVAYSFFGKFAIVFWRAINFSLLAIRDCLRGSRLFSVSILSAVNRFEPDVVGGYDFVRDWVEWEVKKARDWRICFGLDDWREWRSSSFLSWRSDSDSTSESRRAEYEGVRSVDNASVRDCC